MKILIIGGGYLSTVLATCAHQEGEETVVLDYPEIDITHLQSVRETLHKHQPSLVINTAAYTDTNGAEQPENQDKVFAVNVQGPLNLAAACREQHLPWIHFSTAMLFDGEKAWEETDTPTPTGYYTWTKAWADAALSPFATDALYILRIHTPLAALSHPRNFINRLQQFDRQVDIPTSISILEDVYAVIKQLVQNQAPGGIYHTVNQGTISALHIAQLMQIHGLISADKKLQPLSRRELEAVVQAKHGAHQTFPILSTQKLQSLGITLPPAEDAVLKTLANFHP